MPRYQRRVWSGSVYECEEYFSPRTIGKKYSRCANMELTSEEQQKINDRNARKRLSRLINSNFYEGDLFVTLTHKEKANYEDARKALSKYLRKVRRFREKNGLPELKYIAVTEAEKRTHHHMVMSAMDLNIVVKLWAQGRVMVSKLDPGGEYTGLAKYVTKEPREEHKKRWSQSRNLQEPRVDIKRMESVHPHGQLKPPKGYKLVERAEYYSEMTGHIRYIRALRFGACDWAEGGLDPGGIDTEFPEV